MKNIILLSVVSATLLSINSAYAYGESSLMDNVYLGGSFGQAKAPCMLSDSDEECKPDSWKVFGGYKLTDNISVEGGFYDLGKEERHFTEAGYKTTVKSTATSFGLSGVYSYEVVDNLEFFGKAGIMGWNIEGEISNGSDSLTDNYSGTNLVLGVGANYKFTDNLGLRMEYEHFTAESEDDTNDSDSTEDADIDIFSAGLTYSTY